MAKRHFEWVGGASAKFWEIWTSSDTLWTRHGRIGSDGTTVSRGTGSRAELSKLRDQLVREKVREGYVETQALGATKKASSTSTKTTATKGTRAAKKAAGTKAATTKPTTKKGATRKAATTTRAATKPAAKTTTTQGKGASRGKAARDEAPPVSEFDAQIAKIEARAAKARVTLPPGASEQEIAALERALGRTLPAEVRAFYRRHNGGGDSRFVINNTVLLSLKGILQQWKLWRDLLEEGVFADDVSEPGAGVQPRWWIWEWVPITYDGAGNHVVLDLAPARGGTYGQMLWFWHDDGARTVVGKSFLAWLARVRWTTDED